MTLAEAILRGQPSEGGMYCPESLPKIPQAFFNNITGLSFSEIAYVVAKLLFGDNIEAAEIKQIVEKAFNFPVPIVKVTDRLYSLELFHGPTLAFKDFGARFMARILRSMLSHRPELVRGDGRIRVLVATTGNTASAVANGFAGISGVEAHILFPRGVAGRQLEAQFTTIGGNIHAYEVQGTIDDCQALVAQAFADEELNERTILTSANSTNIIRLLPQMFYYFHAMARLREKYPHTPVTVAIPSGNLGNLTAALCARGMGLTIDNIIAAENDNNFLTRFLTEGTERCPGRSKPTLAYAADKSKPTNMPRLRRLCGDAGGMRRCFSAMSFNDADIIDGVNDCLNRYKYVIDPHTALAYQALRHALPEGHIGLMLATAHPAKSLTAMSAITGRAMDLPLQLTRFMTGTDCRVRLAPTYDAFRKQLLKVMNNNR